jgi:hypothetical protein
MRKAIDPRKEIPPIGEKVKVYVNNGNIYNENSNIITEIDTGEYFAFLSDRKNRINIWGNSFCWTLATQTWDLKFNQVLWWYKEVVEEKIKSRFEILDIE